MHLKCKVKYVIQLFLICISQIHRYYLCFQSYFLLSFISKKYKSNQDDFFWIDIQVNLFEPT